MSDTKKRNRQIIFGVIAAAASIGLVVQTISTLLFSRPATEADNLPIPTTSAPALTIKPLPVRPVISAFVTTPEQCPPPKPVPPDKPMRVCDINKTAVYEMGPEGLRVQLTNVDSFLNPLTGVELVQMTMTPESAKEFGQFTTGQVGKQVAFVRAGTVVWGPKIAAPIDGQVLQLSGELTAEQAKEIATMLRDES